VIGLEQLMNENDRLICRYSVMYTRALPSLIQPLLGVSAEDALDYSFPVSIALNSGLAEIYIQVYLSQLDMKKAATKKVS